MSRIFLVSAVFFCTFFSFSYAAQNPNYLVENVAVSVAGKSPTDARNLAVATARRDAFLILLTRLEINTNIADGVSNDEISDMVRSEQIDGEKIAGKNYSATFKIMFAKDFVDHILSQKNLTKVEEKTTENYLVIPVKIAKTGTVLETILWEETNDWKRVIEKISKKLPENSAQKFIIPEADISNISTINRDNIATVTYVALEPMLGKYKAEGAYIMFFSYDEIENKVNINVSYIRKLQKKQIKLGFINVDRLNYQELLNRVAVKTIEYISSSQNLDNKSVASNVIRLQIPINNLDSWIAAKNKIENSGLVSQVNVEIVSRDYAIISVTYNNSNSEITEAFLAAGIFLEQKSENFYSVKIN